ncbi:hypothetical protein C8Q74DRAFT_667217 [Fomes fomentarius]|nr:hypothetical protein C8Q74DRAFT_667217 [Fomes fomentarius]
MQDQQATSVPGTALFGSNGFTPFSTSRPAFPWIQPPWSNNEAFHAGISCGFCGKSNIQGVRYKCIQCPHYDRCSACMASPKAWISHALTHQFFPIHSSSANNLEDYNRVKQSSSQWATKYVHHGVKCDGCNKMDIQGVRHRCLQCNDFDFCEQCIADVKQRQAHSITHPFFPILSFFGTSAYTHTRALFFAMTAQSDQQDAASHVGTWCDLCNQNPLVGIRHKCFDCDDFDMCTRCISDPAQRLKHNLRHTFFPISKPGEKSQFDAAVIVRNMGAM